MAELLGSFEQAALLAVLRLGREAYGRAVLKDVQTRLERDVAAGAVHATLDRLERKGFLSSTVGTGTPIRDGRARRYYRVEATGIEALNAARAAIDQVWRGFSRPLKVRG